MFEVKNGKCLLAQDRVTCLGHIINNNGSHPVKKKVDAIHKAPDHEKVLNYNISMVSYVITT